MLVAVVEVLGTQGCIKVVHQGDVGRVIERGARRNQVELSEQTLGVFVPLLGQEHLATFFIQGEVARLGNAFASTRIGLTLLPHKLGRHRIDGDVQARVILGLSTDDQRRAGLVDQD